jgi:hypothetical protein
MTTKLAAMANKRNLDGEGEGCVVEGARRPAGYAESV